MLLDITLLIVGGVILYFGAEWLVKGGAGIARAFGVRPLIIGLTLVAYGTSAPEFAVSVAAALEGKTSLVMGNVVGSCIANLALVLGITALIRPPRVNTDLIRRELPVLLISVACLGGFALNYDISRIEAGLLLCGALGFTLLTLFIARASEAKIERSPEDDAQAEPQGQGRLVMLGVSLIGLAMLVGGGDLFVEGASGLALELGMSERLIGLTVVAIGTSLPELATSVVAALRGHSDMAIGGIVGSNIFNVFLIIGTTGLINPIRITGTVHKDLMVLGAITVLGVLFMRTYRRISRAEGVILLAAYLTFIVLSVTAW